ncbi:MAG: type II and III secretion system protein family protein [Steroidobacteraceae bacterium]
MLLVSALFTAPLAAAGLPVHLDMYVGDSRVLEVQPARVAIGNGAIVSVTSLPEGELLVLGESAGRTALQLWLRDGSEHRIVVDVAPNDTAAILGVVRDLLVGVEGVAARAVGNRIVLDGLATGVRAQERAAAIASLYPGIVLNFVGKVAWESMIHFDVRIVEVRSSALRDAGVRWRDDIAGPEAGIVANRTANDPGDAGIWPPRLRLGWAATLDSRIRLLEQRGDAVIIAEPMLSCRSGGSARFVSGGELPIPVVDSLGSTDVEFKEYGVILDVKPVAEPDGSIYARIDTQVSQVDEAQRVLGVPGFLKRQSATEVNLREGETLVIAGLVDRQRAGERRQVPGLGRLPLIGSAFRARTRRSVDAELAIFITPRIVQAERLGHPPRETASAASDRLRSEAESLSRKLAPRSPAP